MKKQFKEFSILNVDCVPMFLFGHRFVVLLLVCIFVLLTQINSFALTLPMEKRNDLFRLCFPQDIVYDKRRKVHFVSYLCGDPFTDHQTSYISQFDDRLDKRRVKKFCSKLNAPRSMVVTKKYLIVADQGTVKFFDKKTGTWQKTIRFGVPRKSCVSDIVFDGKRFVYASDLLMGIVVRIDLFRDMESTILLYAQPMIKHPQKLFYNSRRNSLFIASHNGPLYELNPQTKQLQTILSFVPFNPTGMVMDSDFNLYFSNSSPQGQIFKVSPQKEYTLFCQKDFYISNLYFSPKKNTLFILNGEKQEIEKVSLSLSKTLILS